MATSLTQMDCYKQNNSTMNSTTSLMSAVTYFESISVACFLKAN